VQLDDVAGEASRGLVADARDPLLVEQAVEGHDHRRERGVDRPEDLGGAFTKHRGGSCVELDMDDLVLEWDEGGVDDIRVGIGAGNVGGAEIGLEILGRQPIERMPLGIPVLTYPLAERREPVLDICIGSSACFQAVTGPDFEILALVLQRAKVRERFCLAAEREQHPHRPRDPQR
jgi:hypothetical protein